MHGGQHSRARQERAKDDQGVGQDNQHHVPALEQTALLLDHDGMQEGGTAQPGH